MIVGVITKQPAEVRRCTLDFAAALGTALLTGVTAVPSDPALSITTAFEGPLVTFLIAGGITGGEYVVTTSATLDDGQQLEVEVIVAVDEISL